jgi:hypothetical protein
VDPVFPSSRACAFHAFEPFGQPLEQFDGWPRSAGVGVGSGVGSGSASGGGGRGSGAGAVAAAAASALSDAARIELIRDLLGGVAFLHARGIPHLCVNEQSVRIGAGRAGDGAGGAGAGGAGGPTTTAKQQQQQQAERGGAARGGSLRLRIVGAGAGPSLNAANRTFQVRRTSPAARRPPPPAAPAPPGLAALRTGPRRFPLSRALSSRSLAARALVSRAIMICRLALPPGSAA